MLAAFDASSATSHASRNSDADKRNGIGHLQGPFRKLVYLTSVQPMAPNEAFLILHHGSCSTFVRDQHACVEKSGRQQMPTLQGRKGLSLRHI